MTYSQPREKIRLKIIIRLETLNRVDLLQKSEGMTLKVLTY